MLRFRERKLGLGANLPEDVIYPINLFDSTHQPLDGSQKYTIHFDKGISPPADAFWSITLYDKDGFQVVNSLNPFAVSDWMPFNRESLRRRPVRGRSGNGSVAEPLRCAPLGDEQPYFEDISDLKLWSGCFRFARHRSLDLQRSGSGLSQPRTF